MRSNEQLMRCDDCTQIVNTVRGKAENKAAGWCPICGGLLRPATLENDLHPDDKALQATRKSFVSFTQSSGISDMELQKRMKAVDAETDSILAELRGGVRSGGQSGG